MQPLDKNTNPAVIRDHKDMLDAAFEKYYNEIADELNEVLFPLSWQLHYNVRCHLKDDYFTIEVTVYLQAHSWDSSKNRVTAEVAFSQHDQSKKFPKEKEEQYKEEIGSTCLAAMTNAVKKLKVDYGDPFYTDNIDLLKKELHQKILDKKCAAIAEEISSEEQEEAELSKNISTLTKNTSTILLILIIFTLVLIVLKFL